MFSIQEASAMNCRTVCRRPLVRISVLASLVVGVVQLSPRPAHASANVGIEAGIVERNASASPNLTPSFGLGSHIEVGPVDFITFGPYYLQSINNFRDDSSKDVLFNTLGLRTRLVLPLGDFKPYAWAGGGLTWSKYRFPNGSKISGRFWELPVGIGIGYRVLELFQIAAEGAYRPGTSFTGTAYDAAHFSIPSTGWSALLALSLDI
jgi:hypothetical protein